MSLVTPMPTLPTVLGLDPGFASIGYCIVELVTSREIPLKLGVIETKKNARKQKTLACEDNFMRAKQIAAEIQALIAQHRISVICAESMSFPRNASNAAKIALTWGVLAGICEARMLSMVQPTPQQIKKKLTGRHDASKLDIQEALTARYPIVGTQLKALPKTKREHAADALGAIVASLDSDIIHMARRMRDTG